MASTNKIVTQTNLLNVMKDAFVNGGTNVAGETSVSIRNDIKKIFNKETDTEEYDIEENLVVEELLFSLAESILTNLTVNVANYTAFPNYYSAVMQNASSIGMNFSQDYYSVFFTTFTGATQTLLTKAIFFPCYTDIKGVVISFSIEYDYDVTPENENLTTPFPADFDFKDYLLFSVEKVTTPGPVSTVIPGTDIGYENHKIYQTRAIDHPFLPNQREGTASNFIFTRQFDERLQTGDQFVIRLQVSKNFKTNFAVSLLFVKYQVSYVL